MEAIASQRAVQLSTVQSYIAEAMAAGYSYPWHRMSLPFPVLASLCGHLRAYHKQQLLADAQLLQRQEGDASGQRQDSLQQQVSLSESHEGAKGQAVSATGCHGLRTGSRVPHQGGQCHQQQHQQDGKQILCEQHLECHLQSGPLPMQQAAVAVLQPTHEAVSDMSNQAVRSDPDVMHGQGACGHCGQLQGVESVMLQPDGYVCPGGDSSTCLVVAQVQNQQPVQLPDMQLVRELVMTSKGTKAIRDSMETSVLSYGHMRLALAHIYCLLRRHVCCCQQTEGAGA